MRLSWGLGGKWNPRAESVTWSLLELSAMPPLLSRSLPLLPEHGASLSYVLLRFWGLCVLGGGVSLNGTKQNACRAPLCDHFGHIVSATSEAGCSVDSRMNLNVACGPKVY